MSIACTPRVLVVDNDSRVGRHLKRILERYRVEVAQGSGLELMENARVQMGRFKPHVVIMDLRLMDDDLDADRSGLDLIKDRNWSSPRFILYSAFLQDFKITREALQEKFVHHVVSKDEDPDNLLKAVEELTRKDCACQHDFSVYWPTAWDPRRVIEHLFGNGDQLPDDLVYDVLGRLFADVHELKLETLKGNAGSHGALTRGRSLVFRVWPDDQEPFVVKLAPDDNIIKEATAYKTYIQDRLSGRFYPPLENVTTFWQLGGIRYPYLGSRRRSIPTFAEFYQNETNPEKIIAPLSHFFGQVWRRRYDDTRVPLQDSLFQAYDRFLKLRRRLTAFQNQGRSMAFPGLPFAFRNPVQWVIEHEADSHIALSYQAVTHGDLHGDNLFVDGRSTWAIDFERSGSGPILRDFVELEVDIITRLAILPDDLSFALQFYTTLAAPDLAVDLPNIPACLEKNRDVQKALKVIGGIRRLALDITHYQDMREYYWGLLLDALLGGLLAEYDSPQQRRALLFASIFCHRLQHRGMPWPPAEWQFSRLPAIGFDRERQAHAPVPPSEHSSSDNVIFLSYNSRDKEFVSALAEELTSAGIRVWLDQRSLLPGDRWQEEIEGAVESCKAFLFCWGASGIGDWQHEEVRLAIEQRAKQGIRIIPVLLPGSSDPEQMPAFLQLANRADFRGGLSDPVQLYRLIAGIRA